MKRLALLAFIAAAPFLAGCYHRHVYVYHNVDPVVECVGHVHGPNCGHEFVNGCWVMPHVVVVAPVVPHPRFFGWHHFPFFIPIPCR